MLILNLPPCFPHRIAEWKSAPNSKQTFIWSPSIRSYIILALMMQWIFCWNLWRKLRTHFIMCTWKKTMNIYLCAIIDTLWLHLYTFCHFSSVETSEKNTVKIMDKRHSFMCVTPLWMASAIHEIIFWGKKIVETKTKERQFSLSSPERGNCVCHVSWLLNIYSLRWELVEWFCFFNIAVW